MGQVPQEPGVDTDAVLAEFGFAAAEIADLRKRGIVGPA
jgi:crotonobetainyl-CoA:carnitine CoA-transferase CaiB-like acyl-CoA transferase